MSTAPKPEKSRTAGPVVLIYIGPPDEESSRYGALVPGRSYPESDSAFAAYLLERHPDHWTLAK